MTLQMDECFGKSFIKNGELVSSVLFDNSLVYEGDSVYEVIRLTDGYPIFLHDHIERLEKSVSLMRKEMIVGFELLLRDIVTLTGYEKIREGNLKIVFNYRDTSSDYLVYFIEPIYPTSEQYKIGVHGILFHAERKDPESKVFNHKLRSDIYHKLILEGAYEALLVNHSNCITEGSRSNIFFIKNNTIYTAPDIVVLSGITRKYILEICYVNGIEVVFTCVRTEGITDFESVFMSGTSPMVLPFKSVNDWYFNVGHPLIGKLRELYKRKALESINRFSAD
jgi:branched-chain amino acid aminotransferase